MDGKDMKISAIRNYYRALKKRYDIIQYVGIAKDEPIRLQRLDGNKVSLLDRYGYTEAMAKAKCIEYDLLSPIYGGGREAAVGFVLMPI